MRNIYLAIMVLMLSACASAPTAPRVTGTPAPGSKFSKVQLGMSKNQVESIIGKSKDCNISTDPENLYAHNSMITTCTYKSEGELVFHIIGSSLYRMNVDTTAGDFKAINK